jgi:hypothetical protein
MSSGSETLSNSEKYNTFTVWRLWIEQYDLWKLILDLGINRFISWIKNWTVSVIVHGFLEYFISGNCDNFCSELYPLAAAVNTLIPSAAECGWSFSAMNTTISCV